MGSEPRVDPRPGLIDLPVLQKFKLYVTPSNWYLIGRDKKKTFRRILKIDRTDQNELNLFEDPTRYTNEEIRELKRWLRIGNKDNGGFRPHITCYGIIGFVRFLAPFYMLVITKRKKMGEICGHTIYGIAETQTIPITNRSYQTRVADSADEQRYKKLLSMVDLSKNFYFSYTYHLMYNLQTNILNTERGELHDNKMFVWNAHLTRGIRGTLKNTTWTVALIYGFFQQTKCSVSGEEFVLTVIARRSRHYAGTRYLRRGVNDVGRVANDVETEQIVCKEVPDGQKIPITSVVQVRGSIPLYWSQETSLLNPQPEIILNKKDPDYVATKHHFENLRKRYGKRIIILNLLKAGEKKHRESILRAEYAKAIRFINRSVRRDYRLKAIHFDLSKHYRSGADVAFNHLCIFARKALELNDLFFCKVPSGVGGEEVINDSFFDNPLSSRDEDTSNLGKQALEADVFMTQNGVLRTNCIDCLDRTNFAQYAHGLIALAHQLRTLGIRGPPIVDLENPLALKLMDAYQDMGDIIALQYGGSGAHTKMFDELRGNWNMALKPRQIFTAVRRHYNNAAQDRQKQSAINLFLGHFRPQLGRPALWDLDSDQNNMARTSSNLDIEHMRPLMRRSFSDNILVDGELNLDEELGDPQPSQEGLNGGISETNLGFAFYETEPASLSFRSAMSFEDHSKGTSSNQMVEGSSSYSDARRPNDIPGYSHSYSTRFTPAEEMFERGSTMSWSSDNIFTDMDESVTSKTDSSFCFVPGSGGSGQIGDVGEQLLVPGFSDAFTHWVLSGRAL